MANASAAVSGFDLAALESWLWEAACIIRGPVGAPKFKDCILPLIFLKSLSDVVEDEIKPWSNSAKPRKNLKPPTTSWRRCSNALVWTKLRRRLSEPLCAPKTN